MTTPNTNKDACEPSVILYWKYDGWHQAGKVFTSEYDISQWYRHNRWRADGISVIMTVEAAQKFLGAGEGGR